MPIDVSAAASWTSGMASRTSGKASCERVNLHVARDRRVRGDDLDDGDVERPTSTAGTTERGSGGNISDQRAARAGPGSVGCHGGPSRAGGAQSLSTRPAIRDRFPEDMTVGIAHTPSEMRAMCNSARVSHQSVGFVPTMGALHEGHLSLVREARRRAGFVVASVFVNPTQFGPNEDFSRYPRDLDGDVRKLETAGVDAVFAPRPEGMYAPGDDTRVRVGVVAAPLEGALRPGHFEGVATVVAKLFGIVWVPRRPSSGERTTSSCWSSGAW